MHYSLCCRSAIPSKEALFTGCDLSFNLHLLPAICSSCDLQGGATVPLPPRRLSNQDFFEYYMPKTYQQYNYMIIIELKLNQSIKKCQKKTHCVQIIDTLYDKQGFSRSFKGTFIIGKYVNLGNQQLRLWPEKINRVNF